MGYKARDELQQKRMRALSYLDMKDHRLSVIIEEMCYRISPTVTLGRLGG